MRRLHPDDGFTLIELLVVILIIGILASVAIPSFLGQRDAAKAGATKAMLRSAETAARTYFTQEQTYTGMTKDALVAIEPTLADATWALDWCTPGSEGLWGDGDQYCVAMRAETTPPSRWEFRSDTRYNASGGQTVRVCDVIGKHGCNEWAGRGYGGW